MWTELEKVVYTMCWFKQNLKLLILTQNCQIFIHYFSCL